MTTILVDSEVARRVQGTIVVLHNISHHVMRKSCRLWKGFVMRTTITLDDELLARAQEYTGLKEKSALVREALKALIEREAARRLALLGGTEPDLTVPPRRRQEPE